MSAGVRVDPEFPWVNGLSTRRFTRERDQGEGAKGSPPGLQPRMDETKVHPGAEWVLQRVRNGHW